VIIPFFKGLSTADLQRIRQHVIELLCSATGGGCTYSGKNMKSVHARMEITNDTWNAFTGQLNETVTRFKIADRERNELVAHQQVVPHPSPVAHHQVAPHASLVAVVSILISAARNPLPYVPCHRIIDDECNRPMPPRTPPPSAIPDRDPRLDWPPCLQDRVTE
jgi:truncated hemoglobin YjbI